MAEIIRVAFRQLGGEPTAAPLTPPWFMPGAELVWDRIGQVERSLRAVVREVYAARFGESAAARIEAAVPEKERDQLARNLARRPAGTEPLSIVDYLYLGQLPGVLFSDAVQQDVRARLVGNEPKKRISDAIAQIAPVRNEIAHVREVPSDRLLRAAAACAEILEAVNTKAK